MDDPVVVASMDAVEEAQRVVEALDDADIPAEIAEGRQVDNQLPAVAGGGIEVVVAAEEAEEARETLEDARDGWLEDADVADEEDALDDDEAPASLSDEEEEEWEEVKRGVACPECDSQQLGIATATFQAYWLLSFLVLVVAVWFGNIVGTIATWAFLALLVIGIWMLFGQQFPIYCKECGYQGNRSEFDPDVE